MGGRREGGASASRVARVAVACGLFTWTVWLHAGPVPVRYPEGSLHGFLVLRALDGTSLADGELTQRATGPNITARLVFHFKDGSLHDETTVFSQRGRFRLVTDHLVQKGPRFPRPLDMRIDAESGQVIVEYTDDDGDTRRESERLDLPADLANGLVPVLLKNVTPDTAPESLSFVVATPKPRVVTLRISTGGSERFSTGGTGRTSTHYVLKVHIGGIGGVLAPIVGKQPPDWHVWVLRGDPPAFVRTEQPFYASGPVWRVELVSPVWRR